MMSTMNVKKQPDVIADTVTRMQGSGPVPVLLMLHHTNLYPTILERVVLTVTAVNDKRELPGKTIDYNLKLKRPLWHELQYIDMPKDFRGDIEINAAFEITVKGEKTTVINNNQRNTKHLPLRIAVGAPPLPSFENWWYGDTHFHTIYSENQAEFGAPVDVSANMAETFGLNWLVFSDHSFDLDDAEDDSLKNDPALPRWNRYVKEISDAAAARPGVAFIRGEELSCGNSQGQNVHMLVMNNENLIIGNGDSYEGESTPDNTCASVTAGLPKTAAAFAAHPVTELSSVEMYIINRGNWSAEDVSAPGLDGLEAWNNSAVPHQGGFDQWTNALLSGKKLSLIAGSDSHGDFNYEFTGWPDGMSLGNLRTAVFIDGKPDTLKIIEALKNGNAVVTSGPLVVVELINAELERAMPGGKLSGSPLMAEVKARSSEEFGAIDEIKIIVGDITAKEEKTIASYFGKYKSDPMNIEETVVLPGEIKKGYVRAETTSKKGDMIYRGYTNPVWFEM